jgi:hypothetical protein
MSTINQQVAKEILYKFPIIGIEFSLKSFNFYANSLVKINKKITNLNLLILLDPSIWILYNPLHSQKIQ